MECPAAFLTVMVAGEDGVGAVTGAEGAGGLGVSIGFGSNLGASGSFTGAGALADVDEADDVVWSAGELPHRIGSPGFRYILPVGLSR